MAALQRHIIERQCLRYGLFPRPCLFAVTAAPADATSWSTACDEIIVEAKGLSIELFPRTNR